MGAGSGCARQGEESCLEPHLSIEGRKRAGLFLQEEKSYVCKSRRLKILRAVEDQGVRGRSLGRAHHRALGTPCQREGGNATSVPLWPPYSLCRGDPGVMFSIPKGQGWGVLHPQTGWSLNPAHILWPLF